MTVLNSHQLRVFFSFVCIHSALLAFADYLPRAIHGIVEILSWLPWLPLAWFDLATIKFSGSSFPTLTGLIWCVVVWLAIYWFAAIALARLVALRANKDG